MEDMTILYQGLSTLDTIHNFFKLLIASFNSWEGGLWQPAMAAIVAGGPSFLVRFRRQQQQRLTFV